MRGLIFLCCLAASQAATVQEVCKGGLQVDGVYHEKEVLKEGLDRPYQLAVERKTNTLFFSYSIGANEEDHFKSGFIDLGSKNFSDISDIEDGFAAAVDQDKGIVYLGGSDGIYTFDKEGKVALHAKAHNKNIWVLFFKDHLYFVDYPEQKLHVYEGEEPILVPEFAETVITQFAVDKNGQRLFANDTGLYGLEKGKHIEKAKLYDSKIAIRGITLNNEGKAYICGENGIFTLDKDNKLKHIAAIYDAFGLAFDKDNNIIYATSNKIIKLIPSKKKCTVFTN